MGIMKGEALTSAFCFCANYGVKENERVEKKIDYAQAGKN
jgi:hypothetical protein